MASDELEAAREMMASIAHTLKEQGADGVPPPVDKRSWELCGPLGALQRCMAAASRQLEKLHEHRGSLRNETDALSERLANELLTQRQLEKDLHVARSSEAETMRLKEQVSAKQDRRCGEVWGSMGSTALNAAVITSVPDLFLLSICRLLCGLT